MSGSKDAVAEIDAVRRELQSLRHETERLGAELAQAQRQVAQARALAAEEAHETIRMEQLERVLDLAAVTRHVRDAIARAPLAEVSARPVVVKDLLPAAVRQAAIDAIPPPVFRDADRGSDEIPVPPKIGPTYVVATWMFLNDLAKDLMGPSLLARTPEPPVGVPGLELRLVRSVLVQPARSGTLAPGESLTLAIELGEYDWHVGLKASGKPVSASRRRHGDIGSWAPRDK